MEVVQINPFQALIEADSIFVKQKINLTEVMLGCEMANRYKVYFAGPDGKKMSGTKSIFKIKEKGNCCLRQAGNCLATDFEITDKYTDSVVIKLFKPCGELNCPCCFPEMLIYDGVGQFLGKVIAECSCCSDNFTIYDHNNQKIATIYGECCQCGKFCRCPTEPCDKIFFDIIDASNPQIRGSITKVWSGCVKEMFTDADNFLLIFPPKSTLSQKILYFGSVFLVDFLFFEEKKRNRNNGIH